MAGQSAKSSRRRASAGKGRQETPSATFRNEVILWIVLAFSIILFISNFGIAGKLGNLISSLFFGLFGLVAYIFPVLLFAGIAFMISNRNNAVAVVKIIAAVVFVIFICFFLELIGGDAAAENPLDSFRWAATRKMGGGFLGGFLVWLIKPNLGVVSAFVIDFVVLIICLILITERSLWRHIESGGKRVYRSARDETIKQRRQHEARVEERRQRRMDNKVVGVSTDTALKSPAAKESSDAIGELHPEPDFPIFMSNETKAAEKEKREEKETPPAARELQPQMPVMENVPVINRKIALAPSEPVQAAPESASVSEAEDILAKTSDLFSELLPDLSSGPESDRVLMAAEEPAPYGLQETEEPVPYAAQETVEYDNADDIGDIDIGDLSVPEPVSDAEDALEQETAFDIFTEDEADHEFHDFDALIPEPVDNPAPQPMAETAGALTGKPKRPQAELEKNVTAVQAQVRPQPQVRRAYVFPSERLLKAGDASQTGDSRQHLQETALKLQQTLKNFGVNVTILNVSCGPSVTRYEIQPEMGVKVSKIVNLADDIKLNLAAPDIRIEAPIPGKAAIGIEVPNKETVTVMFRELVESEEFKKHKSPCAFAVGKDIAGKVIVTDICKMPHLLIAGATGSGKSVCINTIIMSIIYKADPEDVKLIMVDPKVVELNVYNGIPHLLLPVVTDPKKAAGALHWAVSEMMERYQKFANCGVRDIKGYNAKIKQLSSGAGGDGPQKMPYIVIIVDELADLMMVSPGDVEDAICRLAQLARACGIHLVIATQRPSVNVITGLIKANMPSRIAFSVTSGIDSRTILDINGAEKLLGKGDMLFYPQGLQKPIRVQGAFISDEEVSDVVEFLSEQNGGAAYNHEIEQKVAAALSDSGAVSVDASPANDRDAYFADAAQLIIDKEKASVSMLQRYFKIGFNRAARIMDQLEEAGVVGPEEGTKPRKIQMSQEEFAQYQEEYL